MNKITRVAINGFGRIGRLIFIDALDNDEIEIVAINDLTDVTKLVQLIKYDLAKKRNEEHVVETTEDLLVVDQKKIKIYKEVDPIDLPFKELNIDVVIDSAPKSKEEVNKYIETGVKKVIFVTLSNNEDEKVLKKDLLKNNIFERI